jgi:hypothetical protein
MQVSDYDCQTLGVLSTEYFTPGHTNYYVVGGCGRDILVYDVLKKQIYSYFINVTAMIIENLVVTNKYLATIAID